jgi:hypothetical protein
LSQLEVALNLWYVMDEGTAAIYRLFGRAYAVEGTDEEKLQTLRRLAKTDYLVARQFNVPERFKVKNTTTGQEQAGIAFWYEHEGYVFDLFKEVMDEIEKELPEHMAFEDGEPENVRMKLPQNPLFVLTPLVEDDYGNITPKIRLGY